MMIDKKFLFNDFLGQNKNRTIFIGIDVAININIYNNFLSLFDSLNFQVFSYNSDENLEKKINTFNDIIFVLLSTRNIHINHIDNDSRLFVFTPLGILPPIVKILNITDCIKFNVKIENFVLSNAYVKYTVLNSDLYVNISKLHGFGLYTHKKILKEDSIFTLKGKIVQKNLINYKNFIGEWNALENNMYLIRKGRTSYGFINHSRNPNCEIDTTTLHVIAKNNINKNEELLLDYRREPLSQDYINKFGKIYL